MKKLPLWALALTLPAPAGAATMAPPMRSVEISAPAAIIGLGSATQDGLGVALSYRQSTRTTRRSGTSDAPNPGSERAVSRQKALLLDYRLLARLTAVLSLPRVYYRASDNTGDQTTEGLGDLTLFGKYSLWRSAGQEALALTGVKLPTGSNSRIDAAGNRLAASRQPGSGTVDVIVGGAFVRQTKSMTAHATATYKINGRLAYSFGNALAFDAGLDYRLPPAPWLSLRMGLGAEILARDRSIEAGPGVLGGGTVRDTGSEKAHLAPGLQLRPVEPWAVTLTVRVPVYQNFRGTQLKDGLDYSLGVSTRFWGAKEPKIR